MLGILPPEIILTVLSFVPLRQLQRCRLVSKSWDHFMHLNESSIYHAAAILHDFVPANASLDAKLGDVPWRSHVNSWKNLCVKFYRVESRWEGNGHVRSTILAAPGETVWRFKIDGEQRTVITTHFDGGLTVSAIDENTVLWSLPHSEVYPYAHCEYADGFLVFTREGDTLDVWRRARDARTSPRPLTAKPDFRQRRAFGLACQSVLSASQDDRGAFVPWTAISPPESVRALRLVHSTLLVASASAQEAYLFDVFSGRLKQTISFQSLCDAPVEVNYVELGSRHIFVCTVHDVLVYPLDASNSQTSIKFPSQVEGFHDLYETRAFRVNYDTRIPVHSDMGSLVECSLDRSIQRSLPLHERGFQAVHVSPCGSHFVAVDEQGCLSIVRDFEKALRDNASLRDNITILDMRRSIMNLAFEDDNRIVIYVHRRGIFIVPFVSESDAPVDTLTMQPHGFPRVLCARHAGLPGVRFCSCLQLTRSELWYTWTEMRTNPGNPEVGLANNKLYYINFSEFT